MNSVLERPETKPVKVSVTRLEQIFQNSNPDKSNADIIIKDYVYTPEKRIIA